MKTLILLTQIVVDVIPIIVEFIGKVKSDETGTITHDELTQKLDHKFKISALVDKIRGEKK
jgi:hypothetical protein